ncbi:CG12057 [Drosophila busckii]|uniref:CG12057 n=1 Tax=Drosophila busckii TaxID=30019 RepID=A0A0M4FA02_DROBS|nr:uncharacterized protein LOC108605995 [Drosophila busckii]ALC49475.1 CG12057 [Drosophila busckii]
MKFIIASLLCVCLASVGLAQPMAGSPYDAELFSLAQEMGQLGENTGKALVHQYEEIVVEPQQQLEQAIDEVEQRREQDAECVAAEDEQINSIVDAAHEELHVCGVTAAHDSAEIASDVNHATQQLVFGGYSLGRTYQHCQRYKNSVLKQSCMAKFYVKGTIYLVNARSSIKTIKKSTNERIPAVLSESNSCTHVAADKAVVALNEINAEIDSCIAKRR